jgi:hypothetical protein
MQQRIWKAKVKLSNGSWQEVTVRADTMMNARAMLESQYGKGSIMMAQRKFTRADY